MACIGLALGAIAALGDMTQRSVKEIVADIDSIKPKVFYYNTEDMVNPEYRKQMTRELTQPLQQHLKLLVELEPHLDYPEKGNVLANEACDLALLDLYGDSTAQQQAADDASGSDNAKAVMGKLALLAKNWWDQPDADVQQNLVDQFQRLATDHPRFDQITDVLLLLAKTGEANDNLGNSLRDIVEKTLKGPEAVQYRARPDKIGAPFIVVGTAIDHKHVSTADWKGKVVLIDFWATWCPPCRKSLPDVAKLLHDDHDKGLEVLGISNDSVYSDLANFLKANPSVSWPQFYGSDSPGKWNRISYEVHVDKIPTMFVIDRNGILRAETVNYIPMDLIKRLLEEKPDPNPTTRPAGIVRE
jgi:thiol-disulfide isomerase/thioredoxin